MKALMPFASGAVFQPVFAFGVEGGRQTLSPSQGDHGSSFFRIQPKGQMFSRWRDVTVANVEARFSELTFIEPDLIRAAARLQEGVVGSNLHHNLAIDYRKRCGDEGMQEMLRMAGMVEVMSSAPMGFAMRRRHFYSTQLMYGGIALHPGLRVSPYEQVHDIPGGREAPDVSRSRWSTAVHCAFFVGAMYLGLNILEMAGVGLPEGDASMLIYLVIGNTIALPALMSRNELFMSTWPLHVRQTYEGVQRYGVDGFIAMAMEPWRVFSIMRRLRKLERMRILGSEGFTEAGVEWYRQQMQPAVAVVLEKRDQIMRSV